MVGKDVADALGYVDTADAIKKHVDPEDKLTRRFADSGQNILIMKLAHRIWGAKFTVVRTR